GVMNSCTFLGRMVRDPELRATNAAEAVTGFSLAVERGYTAKDGTRPVDFLDFVAYGQRAMFICKYFAKGQLMAVSAKAYQHSWTARDGT
ncbi:single-stranded DNA-binding protein, partial [Xanthomonas citri pv. citri]|nr:single-stranded DNA-binding protein [Xanthomonas citri pv. citri]